MTIDELWNNLKPMLESMDSRIGNLETDMKEVKTQLRDLTEKEIPDIKTQLRDLTEKEIPDIKTQLRDLTEKEIPDIKTQLRDLTEKEIPDIKTQLRDLTEEKIPTIEAQLKVIPTMQRDIEDIKNINFPTIIKYQTQLSQEIKDVETRLTKRIDECMVEINVKHKEFDYRISNLEWKTKIAN